MDITSPITVMAASVCSGSVDTHVLYYSIFSKSLSPSTSATSITTYLHPPYLYLSVHLSVHPSIYLSNYLSTYLSTYLSIYLSIHLSISLNISIYLPIYVPTCLSINVSMNSAYILVYRRIEEGKDVIAVVDDKGEKGERSAKGEANLKMEGRVAESISTPYPLKPPIDVKGDLPAVAISQAVKSAECKKPLCVGEPPSYWSEKVLMENKEIDDTRMKYNAMTHTAKIRFFCPCHVEFTDPLLVHKTGSWIQRGENLNTVATSFSYKADMDAVKNESENESCIELTLDLRMTVSDVKKAILEVCADRLVDFDLAEDFGNSGIINRSTSGNRSKSNNIGDVSHGRNGGISNRKNNGARNGQDSSSSSFSGIKTSGSRTNNNDSIMNNNESEIGGGDRKDNGTTHSTTHIQLSTLNPFGTGFHPDMPLRPDAILGDVIGKASTMLIWNGRTIGTVIESDVGDLNVA